jgi:hypothetical protein
VSLPLLPGFIIVLMVYLKAGKAHWSTGFAVFHAKTDLTAAGVMGTHRRWIIGERASGLISTLFGIAIRL